MPIKINKILAFDAETTGLNFDSTNPEKDHQMVAMGLIVSNPIDYEPLDELYFEIKWDGVSKWSDKAEDIHGLSKKHLEKHGLTEEEAAMKLAFFLDKHFGIDNAINLLGQNVGTFDLPFLRAFLIKHGLPFKFAHRHFDTFSLSMGTVKAYDSNELYELMGFQKRAAHNALEDARMSLKSYAIISKLWSKHVG